MAAEPSLIPRFEFATAARIVFGAGTLHEAGPIAAGLGKRALVVTGRHPERAAPLLDTLAGHGVAAELYSVSGEPTVDDARRGTARAREADVEVVIGFGGGSALDAGKAVAALLANGGDPLDYLEVIGRGLPLIRPSVPYLAIPTTAGTGAEVTRNAVLASPEHGVKASLRSAGMLPRAAIVDPALTYSLPPDVTASTGLDALTQLVEPYVSSRANPLADAVCREGIRRAARSLRRVCERGNDPAAREDMALASLFGGLALANAGLGTAHGLAGPIGGSFAAPHGAVCACLLPHVMAANVRALREREPGSGPLRRYDDVARLLTGRDRASIEEGIAWVRGLCRDLHVPPLAAYGVTAGDLPALAGQAAAASSMKANPIPLTPGEVRAILESALE